MANCLVTGATGFIGRHLVRSLVADGLQVRMLVRSPAKMGDLSTLPVDVAHGSMEDAESLRTACQGIDTVYHAAAKVGDWGTRREHRSVTVEGTERLLDACRANGVRLVVLVSSASAVGYRRLEEAEEDTPCIPDSVYGWAKREQEKLVLAAHSGPGPRAVIVRPVWVMGPGDPILLRVARNLARGTYRHIDGGGALRDVVWVGDVVQGLMRAATTSEAEGGTFFVTSGEQITWKMIADELATLLDVPLCERRIPLPLALTVGTVMGAIARLRGSPVPPMVTRMSVQYIGRDHHFRIDRARQMLGYEPTKGYKEALRDSMEWVGGELATT